MKEKLNENKNKLNKVKSIDNKILIVKNKLSVYISQQSVNMQIILTEEIVNDITEKLNHFIELAKHTRVVKEENHIDWPDCLVKKQIPNETYNTYNIDILLWYSKILKELKLIDLDKKNNLLKSILKLNENQNFYLLLIY